MTKHTPATWLIEQPNKMDKQTIAIIVAKGIRIASVMDNPQIEESENQANAKLIAAAPELLEALQAVMATKTDPEDKSPWLVKARATIAKATGK